MDVVGSLQVFSEVVRSGNFSEAARHLHVVPSVVAKRIAQLERATGARLFDRTTRSVRLTEAGERLHARASGLLTDIDELVHGLARSEGALEGHLRIMAPTTLTLCYLGPALDEFLALHPRITLEIALVDRSISPQEEGFDLAISGSSASYEGVVDIPLCPTDTMLCASRAYLERAGAPAHPRELSDHACLVFKPGGRSWRFRGPRGPLAVEVVPRLLADDNRTLLESAAAGRGVALLPRYVCQGALDDGRLVGVLPDFPVQETWFKAYVPRKRMTLARVDALLQWLASRLRPELLASVVL